MEFVYSDKFPKEWSFNFYCCNPIISCWPNYNLWVDSWGHLCPNECVWESATNFSAPPSPRLLLFVRLMTQSPKVNFALGSEWERDGGAHRNSLSLSHSVTGVSVRWAAPRSSSRVAHTPLFSHKFNFHLFGAAKKRLNFQLRTKGGRCLSQRGAFLMRITFSTSSFCSAALSFLWWTTLLMKKLNARTATHFAHCVTQTRLECIKIQSLYSHGMETVIFGHLSRLWQYCTCKPILSW